jgi:type VI secretion system protein VasJ
MFADYFSIGEQTHFAAAYRNWVTFGYQQYIQSGGSGKQICSYRFWSKGDSTVSVAVGLLQSSVDSLGRPFPLLLIGTVQLSSWQKMWPAFADALGNVWADLEKIAAERYPSLQDIPAELSRISLPALPEGHFAQPGPEAAPNAVFTGGSKEKSTVIRFTGPLTTLDFIRLWNV